MGEIRTLNAKLMLCQSGDDYITDVTLDVLSGKTNRNNWRYENIEEHKAEFVRKPILIAYTKDGKRIGDGHNFKMVKDSKTGEEYADFTSADSERMVGVIAFDESEISISQRDNDMWVSVKGVIYAWYAKQLNDKLKASKQGGMNISIETLVTEMHNEGDTEVFTKWMVLGVTILNDDVTPAVAGANIKTLSADEINSLKIRAASYRNEPNNNNEGATAKRMKLNKTQIKALQANLSEYTIISADENKIVMRGNSDRCFYGYVRNAEDGDEIVEARIKPLQVSTNAQFEDGESVDITEYINSTDTTSTLDIDNLTKRAENAEAKVKELVGKENARRRTEVKRAINELIAKHNEECPEAPITEAECKDLIDACEADRYTDVEKDGEWCGVEKACGELKSRLYDKTCAYKAEMAKQKKVHSWLDEGRNNAQHEEIDSIDALLNEI